jgi:flagellar hook-length control protein FliK
MDKHLEAPPAYSSLLQSAKLVQRMGEAELRVGIHSGEFGNVDIRTSMAHNQFTAQISVERNELGRVLAAELPNLQNRLSEQRLSSANIILQNQSADSGSSGFQQGSRQGQSSSRVVIPQAAEAVSMPLQSAYPEVNAVSARLDIHM